MTFALIALACSCAGPGPQLFPLTPQSEVELAGGGIDRHFDTDRDGIVDFIERRSSDGNVILLRYDAGGDGSFELEVPWPASADDGGRDLIIILDSVPYGLVRERWEAGQFRHFQEPSRIISPFPVMTDPCIADFFGVSPCRAVEARYYDGKRLNVGFGTYVRMENSPWVDKVDYCMGFAGHFPAYFWPEAWFGHELRRIQERFRERDARNLIAYSVGTSALGARLGLEGHRIGLDQVDRFCKWIIHQTKGRTRITLLSDHGHNLVPSRRIDLTAALQQRGYRVGKRLRQARDVVIAEYGIVTCAAIYSAEPSEVARDAVTIEGVDLAAYRAVNGSVMVISRDGRARITKVGDLYKYDPIEGDPLELVATLDELERRRKAEPGGYFQDRVLFEATVDHKYPDAPHRLWRAFNGLLEQPPDLLLSIRDGYHCGSGFISKLLTLKSSHGSLNRMSSSGFVMSTAGVLDPVIRMEDLRAALIGIGVSVLEDTASGSPPGLAVDPAPPAIGNSKVQ